MELKINIENMMSNHENSQPTQAKFLKNFNPQCGYFTKNYSIPG